MSAVAKTFSVVGSNITIVGGATLVFIRPDTDVGFEVLRCWCGQDSTETSEMQRIVLQTQLATMPTLTSVNPIPHQLGETSLIVGGTAGAAGTCGIDASAEGGGATVTVVPDSFNNLNGWLWIPTPEERIILRAAATSGFGMSIETTPTTLTGWSFGVTFREI